MPSPSRVIPQLARMPDRCHAPVRRPLLIKVILPTLKFALPWLNAMHIIQPHALPPKPTIGHAKTVPPWHATVDIRQIASEVGSPSMDPSFNFVLYPGNALGDSPMGRILDFMHSFMVRLDDPSFKNGLHPVSHGNNIRVIMDS
ncbi:hypothetical protein HAX54_012383 [Datura stramonium]|uniref:Uncharacterized protein n=1 Tax=Datura stramonium TaxID=4076 RepID=A0ABS8TMK7_DATST|nr:hypothetical protein [Datura stramonium]